MENTKCPIFQALKADLDTSEIIPKVLAASAQLLPKIRKEAISWATKPSQEEHIYDTIGTGGTGSGEVPSLLLIKLASFSNLLYQTAMTGTLNF